MKKIINAPENYVDEMLEGIYVAHPDLVTYVADDLRCLVTANKKEGKVGIATGGGSGHLGCGLPCPVPRHPRDGSPGVL